MAAKAQAAMEFLMTYGWAILAVLVVVGALAYFGVLNPSNLVPERCAVPAPLSCKAAMAGSDGLQVALQNTANKDMTVKSISFTSDALAGTCASTGLTAPIPIGQQATFFANGCIFSKNGKQKYQTTITYVYDDATGITNSMTGELVSNKGTEAITGGGAFGSGPGLAVYWKFDSPTPLDDSGTNNNDGTISGNPTWQASGCKSGGCYSFDNVLNDNDYIYKGDNPTLDVPQFTVAFWTYPTFATNQWRYAFGKGINAAGALAIGHHSAFPNNWFLFYGTSSNFFGTYQQNQWAHIAVSYDGATWRTYVNGAPTQTFAQVGPGLNNAFSLVVGSQDTKDWNGLIDDFRVYSKVLTPAEIAALAAQ
ncbi:LamG domain-containing protein [Candidatus Woesearchaeota archaeon]|nr:LamG domain-containing protein [Candidatus Woesearchaeota archaeon]